ncbi:hypothetical protein OEZ85_006607 [Tetradesmus obliquus]|uniref:DNA-directed DNA polymerase n=1 Tax=Tetradesmus obliquus TaxID=3088 RepID=A0ABY8TXM3_TETOB|nr:hypothetical protein OEZ85_006607 [Tetradesmus obliquus]
MDEGTRGQGHERKKIKAASLPLKPQQEPRRHTSSSKRRQKRRHIHSGSPHLQLRLALLGSGEDDDEEQQQQEQQQQQQRPDSSDQVQGLAGAAGAAPNLSLSCAPSAPAKAQQAEAAPDTQQQQALQQQQEEQQQQQPGLQDMQVACLQDDVVPESPSAAGSPELGFLASVAATPPTAPRAAAAAAAAAEDVVPGTPDEELLAGNASPAQQQQQQQQQQFGFPPDKQQQHEFAFPDSAVKAAVTPTMGTRCISRLPQAGALPVLRQDFSAAAAAAAAAATAEEHLGGSLQQQVEDDESSDMDDEELCVGVYSQAAAVARIMRVSQRLDESHRASQLQQLQQQRQQRQQREQELAEQRAAEEADSDDEQQQQQQASGAAAQAGEAAGGSPAGVLSASPNSTAGAGDDVAEAAAAAAADAPGSSNELERELRSLASYLPQPLVEVYRSLGMTRDLYPWQAECLNQPDVLEGANLVYCAPTSGGKSMVAEVLLMRRLLSTGRPALLVMPYVSLCAQKAAHLAKLLAPLGREVKPLYGGLGGVAVTPTTGVIVATIEKANALVNKMLEDDTLGQLSCVVVDELHMVGDDDRGYLLELLLTKLRYATQAAKEEQERRRAQYQEQLRRQQEEAEAQRQQQQQQQQQDPTISQQQQQQQTPPGTPLASGVSTPDMSGSGSALQLIGMSATLPNVDQVAAWLDAVLYQTDFRPVQLRQFVKLGRALKDQAGQVVRELAVPAGWEAQDADLVALLTQETVQAGHSVLIFCASKAWCEITAKHIAKMLAIPERSTPKAAQQPVTPGEAAGLSPREGIVAELARHGSHKQEYVLKDVVARGVAFHHAGLTSDERELVERAYWSGAISVLCATSTLAAGVNLPARRVIFKHPYVGIPSNMLDATKYRQMAGRAGRAGLDTEGEAVLIANQGNAAQLLALMTADSTPVSSCLVESRRGMKRAMLEVVAAGVVASSRDVERYLKCSLLAATEDYLSVAATSTLEALKWLGSRGFLEWQKGSGGAWTASELGKATAAAGLNPEAALLVKKDLEQARMGLCLASDLHLTYLVTPIHDLLELQQQHWEILSDTLQRSQRGPTAKVIEFIGLNMQYVDRRKMGGFRAGHVLTEQQAEADRVARRFYAALVLAELMRSEEEPRQVAAAFKLPQGQVEAMQDKAGHFAHTVAAFCERHAWHDMEALVARFQGRVSNGVRAELVALTEIPYVKGARARLLYKAGLRTPEAVAGSDVNRILEVLLTAQPRGGQNQEQQRKVEKRTARLILAGAKDLVSAKARELAEQQEALLAAAAAGPLGTAPGGTLGGIGSTPGSLALPKSPPSVSKFRQNLQQQQQQHRASQGLRGFVMGQPLVDVRIAAWLLHPDDKTCEEDRWGPAPGRKPLTKGLEALLQKWGCAQDLADAVGGLPRTGGSASSGRHLHACRRACLALKLHRILAPMLQSEAVLPALMGLKMPLSEAVLPALMGLEMPLVRLLAAMEARGIALDPAVLNAQQPAMVKRLGQLEAAAAKYNRGVKFNLSSPTDVRSVLFEKLKLPPPPAAMNAKSGNLSTNAEVLGELLCQHPLPGIILQHRKLSKLLDGFLNTLLAKTIPRPVEYQLALSPASQAAAAAAGDNVSAGSPVAVMQQQLSNIRAAFVAPRGSVLVSADYCQIELRLMAHFSGDAALLAALTQPGADPFVEMAASWLKLDKAQVTPEQRSHAKRLSYGLLYGMGPSALAAELGVAVGAAVELAEDFRRSHPGLDAWIKGIIGGCRDTTWVTTIAGRRRHLPHIRATGKNNNAERSQAERQAVNSVCQGSAADIVKGAMLQLEQQLQQRGWAGSARLLLQVHDELLFEVSEAQLPQVAALVRAVMEGAAGVWGVRVPLPVKLSVGPSWGQLQAYDDDAAACTPVTAPRG